MGLFRLTWSGAGRRQPGALSLHSPNKLSQQASGSPEKVGAHILSEFLGTEKYTLITVLNCLQRTQNGDRSHEVR